MVMPEYRVRLDRFEGPLDLLLYLIRRAELDVTLISIAEITDQYLTFLERVDEVDVDLAGDFLVTAATLVEVKSRFVGAAGGGEPEEGAEPGAGAEEEDPGMDLVRQLLAYRAFRDAADGLEERRRAWERCFPAGHAGFDRERAMEALGDDDLDMEDVGLFDLVEAFQKIIETVNFERLGDHEVSYDDTPIAEHQADIEDRLGAHGGGAMSFGVLFEGRSRGQMIGLFLALLELVREHRVVVEQGGAGEEIRVRLREQEQGSEGGQGAHAWDDDHILDDEEIDDGDDDELVRPAGGSSSGGA